MKLLAFIFMSLLTASVFAHPGHYAPDEASHQLSHILYWGVPVIVGCAIVYFIKNKKSKKTD